MLFFFFFSVKWGIFSYIWPLPYLNPHLLHGWRMVGPEGPEIQEQPRIGGIILARAPESNAGVTQNWHQSSYLEHGVSVCSHQSQCCALEFSWACRWPNPAPLSWSVGWPWYPVVDVCEEIQQESSDLCVRGAFLLFGAAPGYQGHTGAHLTLFWGGKPHVPTRIATASGVAAVSHKQRQG